MLDITELNKGNRIAKNTMYLYIRMLLLMMINLYASRVILDSLGIEDYGIYNVVAGFIAMFSMLSHSMSTAFGRFLTFEIGKGNNERLKTIFSTSVSIQSILSFIVIILGETMGLWILNDILVIPEERFFAANCCYQLTLLSFIIGLLSVPFNATIIAHERMAIFAYISLIEGIGRLAIALLIAHSSLDRLVFFALCTVILSLVVRLLYGIYCKRHFEEANTKMLFKKDIILGIFGFAGWNYLGIASTMIRIHGVTLLINIFFGPAINAARALATKVETVMYQFVTNFSTAFNPQIIKLYASEDKEKMHQLIFMASKFSFFLFLVISIPVFFETDFILSVWLKDVPMLTSLFLKLTIVFSLLRSLSIPLITAVNATGQIKKYQISLNAVSLSVIFPVTYFLYHYGQEAYWGYIVCLFVEIILLSMRVYWCKNLCEMPLEMYLSAVVKKCVLVLMSSIFLSIIIDDNFSSIISIVLIICITLVVVCTIGLTHRERTYLQKHCLGYIKR